MEMETASPKADLGVIIGRFQVPELHKAHRELIDTVRKRHKKVLILLGVAPVKITRNNPLDFMTRNAMIHKAYPDVVVLPIKDMASDAQWSKSVDKTINGVADEATAAVYGSRDSFAPRYSGKFPVVELAPRHNISGTEVRQMASEEIRTSKDFRAGVIYASFNRYPTSYQTVDIAILKGPKTHREVLMARKTWDGDGLWRFVGGFVRPEDESLEIAALREGQEETGDIAISRPKYVGSFRVSDWRYEGEVDKILTSFFTAEYDYGAPKASDDVDAVSWFRAVHLHYEMVVPEHHTLLDALRKELKLPKLPPMEPAPEIEEEKDAR